MPQEPLTPALQGILTHLQMNYMPALNYIDADLRMNTQELDEKLYMMFPIDGFTATQLFTWLQELQFQYADSGNMNIEWLGLVVPVA